jgi:hypothetical protein
LEGRETGKSWHNLGDYCQTRETVEQQLGLIKGLFSADSYRLACRFEFVITPLKKIYLILETTTGKWLVLSTTIYGNYA